MNLGTYTLACPLCAELIPVPYTLQEQPIHAVEELRMTIHLDETALREHISDHTSGPNGGPGLSLRSVA